MKEKRFKNVYYWWLDWKFSAKIISTLLNVTIWSLLALLVANYLIDVNQTTKNVGAQLTTLGDQTLIRAADKVGEGMKVLQTLAKTPSIIEAVKEANRNRANWTPELISLQDKAWVAKDPSIDTTVKEIANNQISGYLIDFVKSNTEEAEVFVTDLNGLNIAMTDRTSDFLQSDEKWWKAAFSDGNGSIYLGSVEYDESSKAYAMNIGVPIIDPDTNKVIGVLRGTLDISVVINMLANMRIGETGTVVLLDSQGTILYSHTPDDFMKPAPDAILGLFKSGQNGWTQTDDLDGNPAIVAYSLLGGDLGKSLGWRLLVTQNQAEVDDGLLGSLLISLLTSILVAGIVTIVSGTVMSRSFAKPLDMLTKMAQDLSTGSITRGASGLSNDRLHLRKDEIGAISRAFERLIIYFRGAAASSAAIANNDLTITVAPNSERDEMGIAFAKMVSGLRHVMGQVAESAEALSCAASQLTMVSEQSGKATNQIAMTIQQVAFGATQQSEDVGKTSNSVEQMSHTIDGVAKGAQEQAHAVSKALTMTAQISSAMQQVAVNAQNGTRGANEATDAARAGAQTVEATIAGMKTIKAKVGLSVQKVREMGQRSERIDTIVETINDIASQTNLLALNAAIEAARVEAKGEKTVENILQQHMLGVASLVADLLASGRPLHSKDLERLTHLARVENFFISDSDGVIVASSSPDSLGFRFSEDPHHQSSVFRPLLNQRDGIVIQPIKARDQDGKPFIYVGVSRRDCPGIIQAGIGGDVLFRLSGYSHGFAVVADEIRKLAEHAKTATKEIASLIRDIQKTVTEAVVAMEDGARDVESGSVQALEAGDSLVAIIQSTEMVNRQVEEIATAVQHMSTSSEDLVRVMEVVSAVIEENTAATEEMATNSSEVTQAIENIASVSEENSAAVEEVSASAEEVLAQVEQVSASAASLREMAEGLQQLVAQFKLSDNDLMKN